MSKIVTTSFLETYEKLDLMKQMLVEKGEPSSTKEGYGIKKFSFKIVVEKLSSKDEEEENVKTPKEKSPYHSLPPSLEKTKPPPTPLKKTPLPHQRSLILQLLRPLLNIKVKRLSQKKKIKTEVMFSNSCNGKRIRVRRKLEKKTRRIVSYCIPQTW